MKSKNNVTILSESTVGGELEQIINLQADCIDVLTARIKSLNKRVC